MAYLMASRTLNQMCGDNLDLAFPHPPTDPDDVNNLTQNQTLSNFKYVYMPLEVHCY